jgi:dCMP deaminase
MFKNRSGRHNYYLDISETVSKRGTCLRRNFGAVIVNYDQIISSGYTGAPRGLKNCFDLNICSRRKLNIPRGQRYELCRSVHAESNAIIHSSREQMIGSIIYLVGLEVDTGEYVKNTEPCAMCKKLIINSGILQVVSRSNTDNYVITNVSTWIANDEIF